MLIFKRISGIEKLASNRLETCHNLKGSELSFFSKAGAKEWEDYFCYFLVCVYMYIK